MDKTKKELEALIKRTQKKVATPEEKHKQSDKHGLFEYSVKCPPPQKQKSKDIRHDSAPEPDAMFTVPGKMGGKKQK